MKKWIATWHARAIGRRFVWVVSTLDTILELNADEHRRLEAPARRTHPPAAVFGEYDYYGVLFQASNLPETKFKSILSHQQWVKLSKHIANRSGCCRRLKAGGFIPEDEIAGAPRAIDKPAAEQQNKRG